MTHEERCDRLQRQLDELADEHGRILVGHAVLEGRIKKQAGLVAILCMGALAVIGLLLNFLVSINDKADASSVTRNETRIVAIESTQAVQANTLRNIETVQNETKATVTTIDGKINQLLLGLAKPRRDK